MTLLSKISRLFDNHSETADHHDDQRLRTHYYRTTKDKLYKECLQMIEREADMRVVAESHERGEISVQLTGKKNGLLIITIIMVRAFHTAVDFSLSLEKGMNFNYCEKQIEAFYQKLDHVFPVSE
ncbi:hypothetical protein EV207_10177 [Scopulibacillus darangshiensis]|uniref:Cytosolic protein n=1 Tax=Scopulibacillus darangshiensis TaxID=442528 RepID=A0A4R2PCL4_9BACL|nr:cytosolic protein [Scopulibacillus darangshiensis]TCP32104.1 hypothetical protein EV207_10177 [Scopulibacillus darangshiensis]